MKRAARRGFTLLELTIALAITAIAMSVGAAALGAVVDRRDATRAATHEMARVTATRATVDAWIAAAEFDPNMPQPFDGAPDALTFRSIENDKPALVQLGVARDALGRSAGLVATVTEQGTGVRRIVIVDSTVTAIALRYRANEAGGGAWTDRWSSTTVLPAAVEVRLIRTRASEIADAPWTIVLEGGR